MSRPTPKWRQAFDKIERTIGVPLENAATSNRFMEVAATGIKVRRAATAKVIGLVHGVTGTVLHAVNIPTRDDVRTLNRHLISLAGEIRAIEQGQRRAAASTPRRPAQVRREGTDERAGDD